MPESVRVLSVEAGPSTHKIFIAGDDEGQILMAQLQNLFTLLFRVTVWLR